MLDDRNHLRCHFRKSELGFCGRACIKRPPILDFSSLPAWSSKKDLRQLIPNTSDEGEDISDEEKAFKELQKTLHCIIASFVKNPQVVELVSMKVNFSSSRKKDGKFWAPI